MLVGFLEHFSPYQRTISLGTDRCGSVGWVSSHKAKGCWFNSVRAHDWAEGLVLSRGTYEKQLIHISHIDVSLPLFLPPSHLTQKEISKI